VFDASTFDQAAGGPAGAGYSIQLGSQGPSSGLLIADNTIGTLSTSGILIESHATTYGPSNGVWIANYYLFLDDGKSPVAGSYGMVFNGAGTISEATIKDNRFSDLTYGIVLSQPRRTPRLLAIVVKGGLMI
jgi:hypothetical protein